MLELFVFLYLLLLDFVAYFCERYSASNISDARFLPRARNRIKLIWSKTSGDAWIAESRLSINATRGSWISFAKINAPYFLNREPDLQEFMGDNKAGKGLKEKDRLKRAVDLTYTGWQKLRFRDEFFMQVIKQTTCNPKSWVRSNSLLFCYVYFQNMNWCDVTVYSRGEWGTFLIRLGRHFSVWY